MHIITMLKTNWQNKIVSHCKYNHQVFLAEDNVEKPAPPPTPAGWTDRMTHRDAHCQYEIEVRKIKIKFRSKILRILLSAIQRQIKGELKKMVVLVVRTTKSRIPQPLGSCGKTTT